MEDFIMQIPGICSTVAAAPAAGPGAAVNRSCVLEGPRTVTSTRRTHRGWIRQFAVVVGDSDGRDVGEVDGSKGSQRAGMDCLH